MGYEKRQEIASNIALFRIIILISFFLFPFLVSILLLLLISFDYDRRFNMFVWGLFWGLYGFVFIPGADFDLVVHYGIYDEFLGMSNLSEFIGHEIISNKPDFILDVFYFLFSRFIENHQIIGFISGFTFYYLMIRIIDNVVSNHKNSSKSPFSFLFLFLLFFSITVPTLFTGMRNGNAIMLFVFLITSQLDFSLFRNKLLLLLPGCIHFSLFIIIALYFLSLKLSNRKIFIICLSIIVVTPLFQPLLLLFYGICSSLGGLFLFFAAKIDSYVIEGTECSIYAGAGYRFFLVVIPLFLLVFWSSLRYYRKMCKDYNLNFILLLLAFSIFSLNSYLFARVYLLCNYVFIIFIFYLFYNHSVKKRFRELLIIFMLHIVIAIIPSWVMGKEYIFINPVIWLGSVPEILLTSVSPILL